MAKIKEVLLDCASKDEVEERIFLKYANGKWSPPYSVYSYQPDIYKTMEGAKAAMFSKDVVVEYVAVARYKCKIESCRD